MKNSQHLKAYVEMHPDNKMAWYLLGKEYIKNGQQGKANYCFNQAGEVYEAFEHSKVPAEMLREYEERLLQASRQRERGRKKLRFMLLAVALLILLMVPSAVAPSSKVASEEEALPEAVDSFVTDLSDQENSTSTQAIEPQRMMYTAQESGAPSVQGKAISKLMLRKTPYQAAILGMGRDGKWLLWQEKLPLDYTLQKNAKGRTVYQSYNPKACLCEPPKQGQLTMSAPRWQQEQEEMATLWSAIKAYQSQMGMLPTTLAELAQPFPNNWIGGTTPVMKREFKSLKALAVKKPAEGTTENGDRAEGITSVPTVLSEGGNLDKGIPYFDQPLRVVVDTQKHRLAIVSGSVLIRNYEVGLGGDKTPEGSFVITDKVVNPNGRDDGDFGSRGLQLSDSNYAIHGTNEPDSIGKDESLGCIRMSREDVEELFALIPKGTKVTISKGVLPEKQLIPIGRFSSTAQPDQTNPHKVYHWLN